MPSADFYSMVSSLSGSQFFRLSARTCYRSPRVRYISFAAQLANIRWCLLAIEDFVFQSTLVQAVPPLICFLCISSQLCYTLPSDYFSRFSPCVSLILRLASLDKGLTPSKYVPCLAHFAHFFIKKKVGYNSL